MKFGKAAAALLGVVKALFGRKPKKTTRVSDLWADPREARPSRHGASFWSGRTKIAPGYLRHRARRHNRKPVRVTVDDRAGWLRDTTFVRQWRAFIGRDGHREREYDQVPVWEVQRDPMTVLR